MLNFDMEKTAIAAIKSGAQSRISDKEFLIMEVNKFLKSPLRKEMLDGVNYYDFEQAIKLRKRLVITEFGLKEDANLPNNRITDNVYAEITDQKVNYLLSKPITFKTGEKYNELLKKIFDRKFAKTLKQLGLDVYNCGVGYLYPFYNEAGLFQFKTFHPWEVLPFWNEDNELDFAARIYKIAGYEGKKEVETTYVELYDTSGITRFSAKTDAFGIITDLVPDYSTYHFELDLDMQKIPYNWNRCPLIAFRANAGERPLLRKCKQLQDGLNKIISDFANSMEENASGNSIIVLKNYDGENLGEFRRNLMEYKSVKVSGDGDVSTLKIEVTASNYESILKIFRTAIIQNLQGFDYNDLKSSGSPNEMSIKSIYSLIDMSASSFEIELQSSFEELLFFVNAHLINTGMGDFTNENIDVIINKDLLIDEKSIIDDCKSSVGLISNRTIIANHPWVTDIDLEEAQIKKESEENAKKVLSVIGENETENETENASINKEKE